MIRQFAISAGLLALLASIAAAAERYEGIWAFNARECQDKDAANSRTLIDLTNREKGRAAPLFDQYEHHCKIEKVVPSGASARLQMLCFEFWQDYSANHGARRESATLAPIDWTRLKIDGKPYVRCAE